MQILTALAMACTTMAFAADPSQVESIFAPLVRGKSPGVAVLLSLAKCGDNFTQVKLRSLAVAARYAAARVIRSRDRRERFCHCITRASIVRKAGKTVLDRGYGVRDMRTMSPIDSRTDFRLASFTKQFTAMAVMLLVHDGKLRYDEPLTQIWPDFPEYGRAITVRHLLTHMSGLPDYEDLMDGGPWSEARQIQDNEVLELLKRQATPKFAAGTSWSYSNSGYVVLGLIVAKLSGVPFDEFLRQRIFHPLRMDRTLAYVKGKNSVPDRAFGHTKKAESFVETDQSSTSATLGDGGVYSNLDDLAKWDEALEKHALLGEVEMKPGLTIARLADGSETRWPAAGGGDNLNPGKPVAYGFGWFLDPYAGHARMWHSGSTRGFSTVIERFTAEKLTIVALCNRTDLDAGKLALQVADVFR